MKAYSLWRLTVIVFGTWQIKIASTEVKVNEI